MSKLCFALVALLAVIAFSEAEGTQKYTGYPWYLNGILPRSYGPAWGVNPKQRLIRPVSSLWWKSNGWLPPRGEPEVKPKPEYKPLLPPWWMRKGILTPRGQPEWKPKPEYKPQLPPWWMRTGVLTPGSQPELKPKPEYKPQLPPWWMRTGILTPRGQPEWKPKPEYKPTFPIPENWLKEKYSPKSEPEWRPKIAINPQPYPEWRTWPGTYFPKSEPEWRPAPVYPPVYPVYPVPLVPRQPYPYSYSNFPFSGHPGFPYRRPSMPYAPIPPVYQYPVHPYNNFMKPSYPVKTTYPYNSVLKNPLYSNWLKQLLRIKAMGPSNIESNDATQSNASSPSATNVTISVTVELKHPNNTVFKNDLKIPKQPLKNILNILAKGNKCYKHTTFQRKSHINDKIGDYVNQLCNTKEIYDSYEKSRYWLLYIESGEKDLDVAYVPNNNTYIKIEYVNALRLYELLR